MSEYAHIQRQIAKIEATDAAISRADQEQLTDALRRLVTRVQLAIKSGQLAPSFANQCLDDARAILAKIGGDA